MAKYTTNYNLVKQQSNEYIDIEGINGNFDIIDLQMAQITTDYTKQVPYAGTTTGTANTYIIATPTISALTVGMAISLKFNLDSTAASTLNWCGKGAKPIKKANGTDVTNIKASGVYTLRYDGTSFILQGEGASGTATASDLLSGKTATTDAGEIVGTYVPLNTSDATATASDILLSKTAYKNGVRITGNIPSKTAQIYTPTITDQIISAGQYINGLQTISGDADLVSANIKAGVNIFGVAGATNVVDTTMATNAVAANEIILGKKSFVNGTLVTGTIVSKAAATITPCTADQSIVAGQYISGPQTISGDPDLISANIKAGINIFGVAGSSVVVDTTEATNPITSALVYPGKSGFVNGAKITGTMATKPAATITPGTADQTIAASQYLTGIQTISGDANLVASKILAPNVLFGVTGTAKRSASGTVVADVILPFDIVSGGTASPYSVSVNGLTFSPNFIILNQSDSGTFRTITYQRSSSGLLSDFITYAIGSYDDSSSQIIRHYKGNTNSAYVINGSFRLPAHSGGLTYTWFASE